MVRLPSGDSPSWESPTSTDLLNVAVRLVRLEPLKKCSLLGPFLRHLIHKFVFLSSLLGSSSFTSPSGDSRFWRNLPCHSYFWYSSPKLPTDILFIKGILALSYKIMLCLLVQASMLILPTACLTSFPTATPYGPSLRHHSDSLFLPETKDPGSCARFPYS